MGLMEITTVKRKRGTELIELNIGKHTNLVAEIGMPTPRDIRICDGSSIVKVELTPELKIARVLKDDVPLGGT